MTTPIWISIAGTLTPASQLMLSKLFVGILFWTGVIFLPILFLGLVRIIYFTIRGNCKSDD